MKFWEVIIDNAKQHYDSHCYEQSIKLNQKALRLSKNKFEKNFNSLDPEKAVASVLISYFNMIDSCTAKKSFRQSQDLFEDATQFIFDIYRKPHNDKKQFLSIINGTKQVYITWSLFMKEHKEKISNTSQIWHTDLPKFIKLLSIKKNQLH